MYRLTDYQDEQEKDMAAIEIPVLIVGGGPAGLTSSIVLSRLGVSSSG
jgi:NADPH-dependent glutamate synthase beta subunit-like oxidoreductase